eukprot:g33449.t1
MVRHTSLVLPEVKTVAYARVRALQYSEVSGEAARSAWSNAVMWGDASKEATVPPTSTVTTQTTATVTTITVTTLTATTTVTTLPAGLPTTMQPIWQLPEEQMPGGPGEGPDGVEVAGFTSVANMQALQASISSMLQAAEPRIRGKDYYKRKREARKERKHQAKHEAERTRQRRHSWDDQYNNWHEDEEEEAPEVHDSGSEPNETDEERSDSELNLFSAPPNASFGEPHVVEERDGWKRIVVNLDTGAAATAIPSDLSLEGHAKTPPQDISYKTAWRSITTLRSEPVADC